MRRAWVLGLLVPGYALAEPATSTLTIEGGAEADSNIQRVETGEGLSTMRVGGPVLRAGFRLDRHGRVANGGYALDASVLARIVEKDEAKTENVALFAADLRWMRAIGERPVAVGAGLSYVDALPLSDDVGARTFRSAGADFVSTLRKGDDRSITLMVGPRYFAYKPERSFDWWGPAINARLDLTLWEPSGGARSVELAAIAGFEARRYDSFAKADACSEMDQPDETCLAPTSLKRRDRYQRVGVELTYTGNVIATLGYALTVIDSNSFGQSIVRHRATLSATTDLPKKLIGTALVSLQIDRYSDGLIVQKDLQHQEFTTLDDANRSSIQFRLARRVTDAWSLEGRVAIWRDLGSQLDTSYRRELVYFGGVYTK